MAETKSLVRGAARLLIFSTAVVASDHLPALAADASWLSNPASNDISTGSNWNTGAVPNNGTATFSLSTQTSLTNSAAFQVSSIHLTADAGNYSLAITPGKDITITGTGVVIDGGSLTVNLAAGMIPLAHLNFAGNSTAGSLTSITTTMGSQTL